MSPVERVDHLVIGAGIVGASIAYHLMVRGAGSVLVLEREDAPATGSTARSAAGVRHQFESEVNIRLSQHSIERLRCFEEEVGGHSGLRQVGYLLLVSDPGTWERYRRNVALQQSFGIRSRLLEPTEAALLVPGTRIDDLSGATYCPDDGYCDPHGVAMGYLDRARALGARVRTAEPVTGFEREGERITAVRTRSGRIAAGTVVNAAGAWAGAVGALAGVETPVRPFRRSIYLTEPFEGIPRDVPLTIDVDSGFYLRKEHDNVLFGRSNREEPSSERLDVDWAWLDQVLEAGVARFPQLADAGLWRAGCWAGLYEITPDHLPILGRHPEVGNLVDASGFSGHGVMHAPATGLLMAEEILDGRASSIDIDSLRIDRFAREASGVERNVY
ncbi:MAG: NAD(P)/FAD-dependent oxidoreductase [Gemmatimonadales bacterium]